MFLPLMVSVVLMSGLPAAAPVESAGQAAKAAAESSVRTVEIDATDDMKYSVTSIPAKAGETLRIRLVSKGTLPKMAMAHNVVVLKPGANPADFAQAAMTAQATDYIPPAMKDQVVASTTMAGPGETVEVTFKVPPVVGNLPYLCTFPGHFLAGMHGNIVVTK
jgi:azurin